MIAIIIITASIGVSRFGFSEIGLLADFSPFFFAGLSTLTIGFGVTVFKTRQNKMILLQLVTLASSIWLAPILIGAQPPNISISYLVAGVTSSLTGGGHTTPPWNPYLYWPGPIIYYGTFTEFTGISFAPYIVLVVPLLMQLLAAALIKSIVPKVYEGPSSRNLSWLAVWFYLLANWTGQLYLADQGFAFLLVLLMVRLILLPNGLTKSLLVVLVFASITVSHGLTSILAASLLIAFFMARKVQSGVVVATLGLMVAWVVYDLYFFIPKAFDSLQGELFNPGSLIESNVISQIAGSPGHILVTHTELYYSLLLLACATVAFAFNLYRRSNVGLLKFVILFSIPIIISAATIGSGYGFELVTRAFLFLTLPMALLIATYGNWQLGRLFLICLLIAMIPLSFLSQYGDSAYQHFSRDYLGFFGVLRLCSRGAL